MQLKCYIVKFSYSEQEKDQLERWEGEEKDLVRKTVMRCVRKSWEGAPDERKAPWVGTPSAEEGEKFLWEWEGQEVLELCRVQELKQRDESAQQVSLRWMFASSSTFLERCQWEIEIAIYYLIWGELFC